MKEGSASWSKLGLGNAWRLTPSTYGYTPADETLLVMAPFDFLPGGLGGPASGPACTPTRGGAATRAVAPSPRSASPP